MANGLSMADFAKRFAALTARQQAALRLRCEGLQNKEIAARLFVSEQTIKNHMTAVFARFGMLGGAAGGLGGGNRSAAVCYELGRHDVILALRQRRERATVRDAA